MKRKRFGVEQIEAVLKQPEAGTPFRNGLTEENFLLSLGPSAVNYPSLMPIQRFRKSEFV